MKKYFRYGTVVLVFFTIFLIVIFPASYLMQLNGGVLELQEQNNSRELTRGMLGPLEVYGARGTIWSGEASAVRFGPHYFENVSWKVKGWVLLLGRVDVNFAGKLLSGNLRGMLSVDLKRRNSAPAFKHLTLRIPAQELISPLIPPNMGIGIRGQIDLQLAHFEISKEGILNQVDGVIRWRQAKIEQAQEIIDLGAYAVRFSSQSDAVLIEVKDDDEGPIQIDLNLTQLISNGDITLQGKIGYRPEASRLIIMMMSAQLGLRGANEKSFNLQGNMNNLPKLLEDLLNN